jgi:hypothetical protein
VKGAATAPPLRSSGGVYPVHLNPSIASANLHPTQPKNLSPLTPDTTFHEMLRNIEEQEEENLHGHHDDEYHDDEDDDYDGDDNYSYNTHNTSQVTNTMNNKTFSETRSVVSSAQRNGPAGGGGGSGYQDFGPGKNMMHLQVLQLSVEDPSILVGWKVFVPAYGNGLILGIRRRKFRTTLFKIQFENYGNVIELPLQRSRNKGKVPFTLIGKIK